MKTKDSVCSSKSSLNVIDFQTALNKKRNSLHDYEAEPAGFVVKVPGSKSISNRAILLASLAHGTSYLHDVLHSEDTQWMIRICRQLGAKITESEKGIVIIEGCKGQWNACDEDLYVGNSGTCARFLTAALLLGKGTYTLRGNERMQERPMLALIEALRALGGTITCLEKEGFLPLQIEAKGYLEGGRIQIQGDVSSQFISALLMVAPLTRVSMQIDSYGDLVSPSYVDMTHSIMQSFGVKTQGIYIKGSQKYKGVHLHIPPDASSASYFFALAGIKGLDVGVRHLTKDSEQSDLGFVNLLEMMGAKAQWNKNSVFVKGTGLLNGICVDMHDMSDVVPTLAIVALFAKGFTEIRHVAHMRDKECDRIAALTCELRKVGAVVEEFVDGLRIQPPSNIKPAFIKTYDDHRIAMAFAILSQCAEGIELEDPKCVSKTYPNFFEDLLTLRNVDS